MLHNVVHGNTHMALLEHALPIPDYQHLGRFMRNIEYLHDLIGNIPIRQEIKEVEVYIRRL